MTTTTTGTTGPLLAADRVDRYRPIGAFGQPAYQSYVQLRAGLLSWQRRNLRYANYFAKPNFDPQNRMLHWTAEVAGSPVAWNDMGEEEQARRALDLEIMRSEFAAYIAELRRQPARPQATGSTQSFASLLEQAMKVPDSRHLHFVGDQPIATFWGFETHDGASIDPLTLRAAAAAPAVAAPAVTAADAGGERAAIESAATARRSWWRWLLPLLALLVLALAFFLWRSCALVETPPAAMAPGGVGRVPSELPGSGERDRKEGAPDVRLSMPGTSSGADGAPRTDAEDRKRDASAPPEERKGDQSAGTQAPRERPPLTDPPVPDLSRPLKLPKDAPDGTAGFLEGEWQAREGLYERLPDGRPGDPLDLLFRFGPDGKGETILRRRSDGATCRAPSAGQTTNGALRIEGQGDLICQDGRRVPAPKVECKRGAAGETRCNGVNPDRSTYSMDLYRSRPGIQ